MKTFRDALFERLDRPGAPSLRTLAGQADVSYEQLKKLRQGKSQSTNVEDAVKIAALFGLTINEFLEDDTVEDRLDVVRTYEGLSDDERRLLRAASRGMREQVREEG